MRIKKSHIRVYVESVTNGKRDSCNFLVYLFCLLSIVLLLRANYRLGIQISLEEL